MNNIESVIENMDSYFTGSRPSEFDFLDENGMPRKGRFIFSETPGGVYHQFDSEMERILTAEEVVHLRLGAFLELAQKSQFRKMIQLIMDGKLKCKDIKVQVDLTRSYLVEVIAGIWKVRPTTSTHMIRALDEMDKDTIFFYEGDLPGVVGAMQGGLSDGGIKYARNALNIVLNETPPASRMSYQEYLAARGGNFSGKDFWKHPIFSKIVENKELMKAYVFALQILNLFDFYHPGIHSGWRPGEMRLGYGRPIALGFKGEAFYPPNNSTEGHCAAVVEIGEKIISVDFVQKLEEILESA